MSLPVNLALWGLAGQLFPRPVYLPHAASRPFIVRQIILTPPQVYAKPVKKVARETVRPKTLPKRRRVVPKTPRIARSQALLRSGVKLERALLRSPAPRIMTAANTLPTRVSTTPGTPTEMKTEDMVTGTPAPPTDAVPRKVDSVPLAATPMPTPEAASAIGPTRDAQPLTIVKPDIPDELRQDDYQSFVPVSVRIDAQGQVTDVTLRGTSGSRELDRRTVAALKRWRWQPAVRDGKPVDDTRSFQFKFEVL